MEEWPWKDGHGRMAMEGWPWKDGHRTMAMEGWPSNDGHRTMAMEGWPSNDGHRTMAIERCVAWKDAAQPSMVRHGMEGCAAWKACMNLAQAVASDRRLDSALRNTIGLAGLGQRLGSTLRNMVELRSHGSELDNVAISLASRTWHPTSNSRCSIPKDGKVLWWPRCHSAAMAWMPQYCDATVLWGPRCHSANN